MKFQGKISVIIPIYNIQDYLKTALNSLKNQTYKYFEAIMINDASTDNSLKIAKKFTVDQRFKLFTNNFNRGLSVTRNEGIEIAGGEYIYYFDPDDMLPINLFELLIEELQQPSVDLVNFNYKAFSEVPLDKTTSIADVHSYDQVDSIKLLLLNRLVTAPWAYITRLKILKDKNIRFPKNRNYEDIMYTPQLMSKISLMKVINFANGGYFYRVGRKDSITEVNSLEDLTKEFTDKICLDVKKYHYLMKNYPSLNSYIQHWYFNELVGLYMGRLNWLYTVQSSNNLFAKLKRIIVEYVNEIGPSSLSNKEKLKFYIVKNKFLRRFYYVYRIIF